MALCESEVTIYKDLRKETRGLKSVIRIGELKSRETIWIL